MSAGRRVGRRFVALAALLVLLVAAGAAIRWMAPPPGPVDPDDPRQVALGKSLYDLHCAACHGIDLEGEPDWRVRGPTGRLPAPPHDETGHTWHHPDADLIAIIARGLTPPLAPEGYESDMPGFGEILSEAEIRAVLAYIKSRWPPEIRRRQSAIDAAASR